MQWIATYGETGGRYLLCKDMFGLKYYSEKQAKDAREPLRAAIMMAWQRGARLTSALSCSTRGCPHFPDCARASQQAGPFQPQLRGKHHHEKPIRLMSGFFYRRDSDLSAAFMGFVRDVMIAGYLGSSRSRGVSGTPFPSPTCSRRFFAEGAVQTLAFVPMFLEKARKAVTTPEKFAQDAFVGMAFILEPCHHHRDSSRCRGWCVDGLGFAATENVDTGGRIRGGLAFPLILFILPCRPRLSGVLNATGAILWQRQRPLLVLNIVFNHCCADGAALGATDQRRFGRHRQGAWAANRRFNAGACLFPLRDRATGRWSVGGENARFHAGLQPRPRLNTRT